jgi:hypothetical protein
MPIKPHLLLTFLLIFCTLPIHHVPLSPPFWMLVFYPDLEDLFHFRFPAAFTTDGCKVFHNNSK